MLSGAEQYPCNSDGRASRPAPRLASTSPVDTSGCSAPQLSQPLLSVGDSNWYTMTPGETVDNFDGSGWTLTGGAQIKTTTLADGHTGSVLDLPSGSKAVSPTMCVNTGYQTVRTDVRNVVGAEGVQFYVSYAGHQHVERSAEHGTGPRPAYRLDALRSCQRPAQQQLRAGNSCDSRSSPAARAAISRSTTSGLTHGCADKRQAILPHPVRQPAHASCRALLIDALSKRSIATQGNAANLTSVNRPGAESKEGHAPQAFCGLPRQQASARQRPHWSTASTRRESSSCPSSGSKCTTRASRSSERQRAADS